MKILALDLGKFKTVACVFDSENSASRYQTIKTVPFAMQDLMERHQPDRVVMEIGPIAGWVHDIVVGKGIDCEVANCTHEAWRWRNVKRKTDRADAEKLAKLSAMGQIPTVHVPSPRVRQWRSLIAYRQKLVSRRTAIKNSIRAILVQQGLGMPPRQRGWSRASLEQLSAMSRPLDEVDSEQLWRGQLHEELLALEQVAERLGSVESKLDAIGRANQRVQRLRTIPGVGPRLAEALVATIDDPRRFRHGKEVGCYVGLTPRQYQSGSMDRQGRISCQGNPMLRRLLIEISWLALRHNGWARETYLRLLRGSPTRRKIAIVAVARKLLVRAWAMLRDDSSWRSDSAEKAA